MLADNAFLRLVDDGATLLELRFGNIPRKESCKNRPDRQELSQHYPQERTTLLYPTVQIDHNGTTYSISGLLLIATGKG